MKVVINGQEINIDKNEKEIAEKLADIMLDNCKQSLLLKRQSSLYFATIIMLHTKTGDILRYIDDDLLKKILEKNAKENPSIE